MQRRSKTVAAEERKSSPVWTAIVLMASFTGLVATASAFLVHNHEWTDTVLGALPAMASALAADPGLAGQMRIKDPALEIMTLADQTRILVAQSSVVNDALIPAANLSLEVRAYSAGEEVRQVSSGCGKNVSAKLLRGLRINEVVALLKLDAGTPVVLYPGKEIRCQVAIPDISEDVDEISLRIAYAEALPGHPPAHFRPHLHRAE